MALAKDMISQGLSSAPGKEIVFKRYINKAVVTKYPNMKNIVPSAAQITLRNKCREAHPFAKNINNDPERKAAFALKIPDGRSVYRWVVKEFMNDMNR